MYQIALYNMKTVDRVMIQTLLERYAVYTDTKFKITFFASGFDLLASPGIYHLVLVDISSERESTLKIAANFLNRNPNAKLVLLSDDVHSYQDGYRIGAHRFFVKPLVDDRFFSELGDILADIALHLSSIQLDDAMDELVSIDSIFYAESENRTVRFYTKKGVIVSHETFSYWHDFFSGTELTLCSRGCLVNLKLVRSIEKTEILMLNGQRVAVSRRLRSTIVRKFGALKARTPALK